MFLTASLEEESPHLTSATNLGIARLLKRLEAAISIGNHSEAGQLAKELATLKVTCSVTPRESSNSQREEDESAGAQYSKRSDEPQNSRLRKSVNTDREGTNTISVGGPSNTQISSTKQTSHNVAAAAAEGPPLVTIEVIPEIWQDLKAPQDSGVKNEDQVVQKREVKSITKRREVKSDNVSKLIESSLVSSMPSIIENFK